MTSKKSFSYQQSAPNEKPQEKAKREIWRTAFKLHTHVRLDSSAKRKRVKTDASAHRRLTSQRAFRLWAHSWKHCFQHVKCIKPPNRVHYAEHSFLCFISIFKTIIKMFMCARRDARLNRKKICVGKSHNARWLFECRRGELRRASLG